MLYLINQFISCADLKKKLAHEFANHHIKITPKASLIEEYAPYTAIKTFKYLDGKQVNGFSFGKMIRNQKPISNFHFSTI